MSILRVPVTSDDHIQGEARAPVTLVEYGDYECPMCGLAYPIVKRVQKHFGRTLRLVYRHFPMTQVHPHAEIAAQAAEFAGEYHQFWVMHDALYENQDRLSAALLFSLAEAMALPEMELRNAILTGRHLPKIKKDFLGGVRSGVNGTPTFFVRGRRYEGPFDFEYLVAAIQDSMEYIGA
jgi:protein-disulfide isomerase